MDHHRRTRVCSLLAAVALVAAAPAVAVKRRAFVTSVTGAGNLATWSEAGGLTGLAAGDNICQVRAILGGLPNALAYRAWLSTSTTDAFCHVQGLTGKKVTGCNGVPQPGAGPWYLVNGITPYTASLADLTGADAEIYRSVVMDEFGDQMTTLGQAWLWTGTDVEGEAVSGTCTNWTDASAEEWGMAGSALGTRRVWTYWGYRSCEQQRRLLCLEAGASEATPPHWSSPGALVFVTSAHGSGDLDSWPAAGGESGLAAGDAICRNLAAAAHLPAPESFVAWLSAGGWDAADRVLVDAPFKRIDGLSVAQSRADLLDGATSVSIHQDETGRYGDGGYLYAWTGTAADGSAQGADCDMWTGGSVSVIGSAGSPGFARTAAWSDYEESPCDEEKYLYCFSNVVTLFWDGFDYTGDTSRWSATAN